MFDQKNTPESSKRLPHHGGNLTAASETFGVPPEGWLDLSTGINPACYPKTEISENALRMLPIPGDIATLLDAARQFYRAPSQSQIIAAPGTQAVLQNLPLLYPGRKIRVLSPTYSEHRHSWEQAGNEVIAATEFDALAAADIAIVVNPNNPDGRTYAPEDLLTLAQQVELLIIDEAFCDGSPELSVVPHLSGHNILVLRSLGKFFGLAGLRLGFVIGNEAITEPLLERLGPWAVSGPAIEIGSRALSDTAWIARMQESLKNQSARLNEMLAAHQLAIHGGTELFTLIETARARDIYHALGQAGILVRAFDYQPDWLRIGLPGDEKEWLRLEAALKTIDNMAE